MPRSPVSTPPSTPLSTPVTKTRPAHAKINLCLSVGPAQPQGTEHEGKDVSGFHRIATWMACVELHDDVTITRKAEGEESTFGVAWAADAPRPTPIDWMIEKDLAVRAHRAIEKKAGRELPVDLRVTKRIPVGGGFGGGSSDAATALILLNEMFELGMSPEDLRAIAFTLGSDVAFFIDGPDPDAPDEEEAPEEDGQDEEDGFEAEEEAGDTNPQTEAEPFLHADHPRSALVSSFGERIERADPIEMDVVVVVPAFSCVTKSVYLAFDELQAIAVAAKRASIAAHKGQEAADAYEPQDARDDLVVRRIEKSLRTGELDCDTLFNDLFLPAVHVEPRVGRLITALSKGTRTRAHLTGSGSGVFLLAGPGKGDNLLAKVRKTLDRIASQADETQVSGLAGETFAVIRTRLL